MKKLPISAAISTACRLGLAAVWLASGGIKAADPDQTEAAVRAYRLAGESWIVLLAVGLPLLEIGLGLLLAFGIATRLVAGSSVVVLGGLIAAVLSAWLRGLSIDCGCFGGGGEVAGVTWWDYLREILRDAGFVALALWLLWRPRTWLAIGPGSRLPVGSSGTVVS